MIKFEIEKEIFDNTYYIFNMLEKFHHVFRIRIMSLELFYYLKEKNHQNKYLFRFIMIQLKDELVLKSWKIIFELGIYIKSKKRLMNIRKKPIYKIAFIFHGGKNMHNKYKKFNSTKILNESVLYRDEILSCINSRYENNRIEQTA